jgi:hypothetical protein
MEVTHLLVEETNKYYSKYVDTFYNEGDTHDFQIGLYRRGTDF